MILIACRRLLRLRQPSSSRLLFADDVVAVSPPLVIFVFVVVVIVELSPHPLELLSIVCVVALTSDVPDNVECSVVTDNRLSTLPGTVYEVNTSFGEPDDDDDDLFVLFISLCFFKLFEHFCKSQNLNVSSSGVSGS